MTAPDIHCTTVDLAATRAALIATLETGVVNGQPMRVNAWLADVINPPCALVGVWNMTWEDSTYQGLPTALVAVRLVVPGLTNRVAQLDLDELQMAYATALLDDPTLSGAVKLARPVRSIGTTFVRGAQEFPCSDCDTLIVF